MRHLFLPLLCLLLATDLRAQTSEDSIRNTVASLFTAMRQADGKTLQSLFHDSARLCTVSQVTYRCNPASGFITYVGKLAPGDADERARVDHVLIDGPLALAWTPYSFYAKAAFSHCGVNLIQLVRTPAGWKILHITDTRRKSPCPD